MGDRVIVGATSWWRKCKDETVRKGLNYVVDKVEDYYEYQDLTLSAQMQILLGRAPPNKDKCPYYVIFGFLEIAGADEAAFEAMAVRYAQTKATDLELPSPRFVMGCGGGSIQMVDLEKKKGEQGRYSSIDNHGTRNGVAVLKKYGVDAGLRKWNQMLQKKLGGLKVTASAADKAMCISAAYYASLAAGISPDQDYQADEALDNFEAALDSHTETLKDLLDEQSKDAAKKDDAGFKKKLKKAYTNVANTAMQVEFISAIFKAQNCKVSYHRNWKHPLPGKAPEVVTLKTAIKETKDKAEKKALDDQLGAITVPFRTTWTAGYYIELLNNQGYDIC